jgi:hypothetical protein
MIINLYLDNLDYGSWFLHALPPGDVVPIDI